MCTFFVSIKSRCSQAEGLNTIPRLGYQVTDLNACDDGTRVRCLAITGSMVRTWSVARQVTISQLPSVPKQARTHRIKVDYC